MKKAQLTLFIILGLVIISVFGFVFFMNSALQKGQIEAQAEKAISQLIEARALRFYVNQCTERGIKNGLDLISKQGGKIFPGQMGSLMQSGDKVYLRDEGDTTYFISYGILKPNLLLPQYPCFPGTSPDYDKPTAFCAYNTETNKFNGLELSIANLPKLCKDRYGGCDSITEQWDTKFSVQSQFESFVSSYVKECVDFESIVGINNSYNITEGDVSTQMILSDNKITAKVNFPIVAEIPGTQPIISLLEFQKTIPTRFKQAYSLARSIIINDLTSPSAKNYEIKKSFLDMLKTRFRSEDSGFAIEIIENITKYDDLVIISDLKADPGYPLVLQFMIENRPPVLEYYGSSEGPTTTSCGVFDYIVMQDKILRISPEFFDMNDHDPLTFSYDGWLIDYNETFYPENPDLDEFGCPKITGTEIKELTFENRRLKKTQTGLDWEMEALVTENDIGYHILNLTICDSEYCDYQEIRILVDDLIKLFVNKTSKYDTDEFRHMFSLEDPMTFTAKVRDIYKPFATNTDYVFQWRVQNSNKADIFVFSGETEQILKIPENENIITIKEIFNDLKGDGTLLFAATTPTPTTYYVVSSVDGIENKTSVNPVECIPYMNGKNPFPYNESDPYLANHACCNPGTNTIKSSGVCFSETKYGSFKSFVLEEYNTSFDKLSEELKKVESKITETEIGLDATIKWMQENLKISSGYLGNIPSSANDIIESSFNRNCDGSRGNICIGNGEQIFSVEQNCKDKSSNEIATCHGPSIEYVQGKSASNEKLYCEYDYSGTNLEKVLGLTNDPACNLNSKCVSNPSSDTGYSNPGTSPRYLCNATCGTGGCTKTTESICHDCYKDQICVIKGTQGGPTSGTPTQGNIFTVKTFNSCSSYTNKCELTSITPDPIDICQGTDSVLDHYCVEDKTSTTSILKSAILSCKDIFKQPASDNDDGRNPYVLGTCTANADGVCGTNSNGAGQCYDGGFRHYNDGKIEDPVNSGNYKLAEYYPSGVSCIKELFDYDYVFDENVCRGGGFVWIASNSVGNQCCGDDLGDVGCNA